MDIRIEPLVIITEEDVPDDKKKKITTPLDGFVKCPRCWKYHTVRENFVDLCDDCGKALMEGWPDHEAVPFIKAALQSQKDKYKIKMKFEDELPPWHN